MSAAPAMMISSFSATGYRPILTRGTLPRGNVRSFV